MIAASHAAREQGRPHGGDGRGGEAKRGYEMGRGSSLRRSGSRPFEDATSLITFNNQPPRLIDRSPIFDGVAGDLAEGEPQRRPVSTPRERPVGVGPEQAPLGQAIAANNERLVASLPGSDVRPRWAPVLTAGKQQRRKRPSCHPGEEKKEALHGWVARW